jgi:hypothetical protein
LIDLALRSKSLAKRNQRASLLFTESGLAPAPAAKQKRRRVLPRERVRDAFRRRRAHFISRNGPNVFFQTITPTKP